MKKMIVLLAILPFFMSCKKCDDDNFVGIVHFSDNSLSFIPYLGGETIHFQDEFGTDMPLQVSKNETIRKRYISVNCSSGTFIFYRESGDYINAPYVQCEVKNDSVYFPISLSMLDVELANPAVVDSNFVELVSMSYLPMITDTRGKTPLYNFPYEFHNSIPVLDTVFTAVYANQDSTYLYNKAVGIVAFKHNNILYRYKRTN